ncbi:MAG: hypothetical protein ACK6EB_40300, partial [Planctomyces sp.]
CSGCNARAPVRVGWGWGKVLGLESPSYGRSVAEDGRWTKGRAVGFPVALPGGVVLSILCDGSE